MYALGRMCVFYYSVTPENIDYIDCSKLSKRLFSIWNVYDSYIINSLKSIIHRNYLL